MKMEIVDLYQYFAAEKAEGRVGKLLHWQVDTPEAVSCARKKPAVLIVPGGGYGHTSEREAEPVALRFAARGYIPFVLRYSCAPARFPVALREAAWAMAYIRRNAEAFGIDPNMVAAIGFSAGGHLCTCLGTMYDSPYVADIAPASQLRPDVLGLSYPVAVSWGRTHDGSFDNLCGEDAGLRKMLSADALVRPDMPPAFIWHTRNDASVPCRNSLLLAEAMEREGVDFTLHLYRRGPHGLSTADCMAHNTRNLPEISWDVPGWLDAMLRFFADCGLKTRDFEV